MGGKCAYIESLTRRVGLTASPRIFAIEGILTIGLALVAFVTLTDRPETARWMSEEEKEIAINRVKSERLAQAVLLDKVDATKLKRGFTNPITLATAMIFLLDNITVLGISFFLPTIIRTIYPGRTTVQQQLLTVPPYIVGAGCTVIITTLSWRMNSRQTLIALTGPLVVAGYAIFLATMNANIRYGAVFLSASTAFSLGAMTNAQVSANAISDSARNIAIGTNGKCHCILPHMYILKLIRDSYVWLCWRFDCHLDIPSP